MGKPKGMYIHPDKKRKEVTNLIIRKGSKDDNKSNMRSFVRGKR